MRKTGLLRAFIILTVVFGLVAIALFASGIIKLPENSNNELQSQEMVSESDEAVDAPAEETIPVTTISVSRDNVFYVETSGVTDAQAQIPLYAPSSAQVKALLVNEGEVVYAGDPLIVLGGTNDAEHPLAYQLEIALQNYETAKKGYEVAVAAANAGVNSAELQVENAQNQLNGYMVDDQVYAQSYQGSKDSEGLTKDTLLETQIKNERDIENLKDSIEDMEDSLDELEDMKNEVSLPFADQYSNVDNDLLNEALNYLESYNESQIEAQISQLEQQIETSKKQLETLQSGAIIGENQILGQVMQVENQLHTLQLNRESSRLKMGIDGDTSTSVKMAEQGLETAQIQANSAIIQAQSQLEMARINLDSAQDQMDALTIKAPVTGVVSDIRAKVGSLVSPQVAVAEVTNERLYLLKASINVEDAARIAPETKAEVLLGSRYVRLPIKSVSPTASTSSRLVEVTIELPAIKFTSNQILEVKIPISPSSGGSTFFVPLDAVTIGSQQQFLFINDSGHAKRVVVELGEISGDLVEIKSGLNGGEEIIVKGAKDLTDGQSIEISN